MNNRERILNTGWPQKNPRQGIHTANFGDLAAHRQPSWLISAKLVKDLYLACVCSWWEKKESCTSFRKREIACC